ncbi:hypothetical protein [Kitasatospora sp. GP82]|uniref:hypothetical protein n=1 Tax=Kitasatospora sp. GP82 TaxID=3035089 RepID=UPI00247502B1|nr:hypothetical protein [Kitasatospora sp. GP82]MDH6128753.1 hypothetical protein [Kitasatospora sp. GP82]
MNETRQQAVPKYFRPTPTAPELPQLDTLKVLCGIGGAMVLLGLIMMFGGSGAGTAFLGFLLFAGGCALAINRGLELRRVQSTYEAERARFEELWAKAMPKPSDEQMDLWLHESIGEIKRQGFGRLNLAAADLAGADSGHGGQDPLIVLGVPDQGTRIQSARGKDGEARFSFYDVTLIFLTRQKLCAYQCTLDLAAGASVGDATHEFFYQHINTLSTRSDRVTLPETAMAPQPAGPEQQRPALPPSSFWVEGNDEGRAWHITTKQLMEIGVAGDRISVVVGIEQANQFGGTDMLTQGMRSRAEAVLAEIRKALHAYGTRSAGGVGATEQL